MPSFFLSVCIAEPSLAGRAVHCCWITTRLIVPLDWNIPIKVVDTDIALMQKQLPPAAEQVAKLLSPINQSVFLYGWATGRTTISSNRTVAKEIEGTIETHRLAEDDAGPDIWLCPTARSLVGKEKTRRNWEK